MGELTISANIPRGESFSYLTEWKKYTNSTMLGWIDGHGYILTRYEINIPNNSNDKPVSYVQNLEFVIDTTPHTGRLTYINSSSIFTDCSYCLVPSSDLKENGHPEYDYLIENQEAFTLPEGINSATQQLRVIVDGNWKPGKYYLYLFRVTQKSYSGLYLNNGEGASYSCTQISYTKCNSVKNFYSPEFLQANGASQFELKWESGDLDGIENKAIGFRIYYAFEPFEDIHPIKECEVSAQSIYITLDEIAEQEDWELLRGKQIQFLIEVIGSAGEDWNSDKKTAISRINQKVNLIEVLINGKGLTDTDENNLVEVYGAIRPNFKYSSSDFNSGIYTPQYSYDNSNWNDLNDGKIDFSLVENMNRGIKDIYFRIFDNCEYSNLIVGKIYLVKDLNSEQLFVTIDNNNQVLTISYQEQDSRDLPTSLSIFNNTLNQNISLTKEPQIEKDNDGFHSTMTLSFYDLIPNTKIIEETDFSIAIKIKNNRGEPVNDTIENEYEAIVSFSIPSLIVTFVEEAFYSLLHGKLQGATGIKTIKLVDNEDMRKFEISSVDLANQIMELIVVNENLAENFEYKFSFVAEFGNGVVKEAEAVSKALPRPKIQDKIPSFDLLNNTLDGFEDSDGSTFLALGNGLSIYAEERFTKTYLSGAGLEDLEIGEKDTTSDPDTNRWIIPTKRLRNWIVKSTIINGFYGGTYILPIRIKYSLDDGSVSYLSKESNITVNFDKIPIIEEQNISFSPVLNNIEYDYFQEGLGVKILLNNIKIYSHQKTEFILYVSQDQKDYSQYTTFYINQQGKEYGANFENDVIPDIRNLVFDFSNIPLKEIKSSHMYFKILIKTGEIVSQPINGIITETAIKHFASNFVIVGGKVNSNNETQTKSITLEVSGDWGYSDDNTLVEIQNTLYYNNNESELDKKSFDYNIIFDDQTTKFQTQIKYVTTVRQGGHSITKEQITNVFFVYDEAPTVAYRPNCIGINTKNPESVKSDAAVIITQSTGKERIYFIGEGAECYLDISDGTIYNLTVNCGSWDENDIRLLSFDNNILKESKGLYLTIEENE